MPRGVETARDATPATKPRTMSSQIVGLCALDLDFDVGEMFSRRRRTGRVIDALRPWVDRERRNE